MLIADYYIKGKLKILRVHLLRYSAVVLNLILNYFFSIKYIFRMKFQKNSFLFYILSRINIFTNIICTTENVFHLFKNDEIYFHKLNFALLGSYPL